MKKYFLALTVIALVAVGCDRKEPVIIKPDAAANSVTQKFTMVEVAKHATKSDCYSVVSGSVYDLTNWITQHPGGEKEIMAICGKDGTASFQGEHSGQSEPARDLANFKIGTLVK